MTTSKKTRKLLLNSGRTGVVYDSTGRSLGGGERLEIDDGLDEVGQAAVDRGFLTVVEVPAAPSK